MYNDSLEGEYPRKAALQLLALWCQDSMRVFLLLSTESKIPVQLCLGI